MLLVSSLSPLIAWFYKTPELKWVAMALSCNFLINGMAVQHQALLNRQMRFVAIAIIQIGSMLAGISVAIIMALRISATGRWCPQHYHFGSVQSWARGSLQAGCQGFRSVMSVWGRWSNLGQILSGLTLLTTFPETSTIS